MNFANPSFVFTPTSLTWDSTDWSTSKSVQACANADADAANDLPYATVESTSQSYSNDESDAFRVEVDPPEGTISATLPSASA